MRNKKIKFIIVLTSLLLILFSLAIVVNAQGLKEAFDINTGKPLGDVLTKTGYNTSMSIEPVAAVVINTVLSMLGVLFLILMLYGGYLWMTAAGKEERVTKAKNLITAAIIGVILVVSAYAISYFVIEKLTPGVLDDATASTNNSGSGDDD